MTAAVRLAFVVLEATVPLADLESDLEPDLVVWDAASDVFVGDALEDVEDVEDVSTCHVNYRSWCPS